MSLKMESVYKSTCERFISGWLLDECSIREWVSKNPDAHGKQLDDFLSELKNITTSENRSGVYELFIEFIRDYWFGRDACIDNHTLDEYAEFIEEMCLCGLNEKYVLSIVSDGGFVGTLQHIYRVGGAYALHCLFQINHMTPNKIIETFQPKLAKWIIECKTKEMSEDYIIRNYCTNVIDIMCFYELWSFPSEINTNKNTNIHHILSMSNDWVPLCLSSRIQKILPSAEYKKLRDSLIIEHVQGYALGIWGE